ncbi:hypothetical protein K2173_026192 [Erythroxylum novogranatense]|uniref:B30.2/SPRY domain-containing protein n=1 Tax=Erythroxylum novogranatense TaxID=1862640 RepID=A0AAV8TAE4_9ROSI|nr:hypothetical protein K2173_026192 [Erythroxylum novogranatense]
MVEWMHVLAVAGSVILVAILFIFVSWRYYCLKQRKGSDSRITRAESLQEGTGKLHQESNPNHHQVVEFDSKRRGNYYVFRRAASTRPLFNWADHPALITDAVENGWSRFALSGYMSTPSAARSSLLGLCAVGDYVREADPEISWEVSQGSVDFMQKIRLNSGIRKVNVNTPFMSATSVIRTALPLPGPPLGNSAFPQEAYFEITIVGCHGDDQESVFNTKEGEKTKLIRENLNVNGNSSDSLLHANDGDRISKIEERKIGCRDEGKDKVVVMSLGLTVGGSLPLKIPGSYFGSVGFNSNGSVYLDGAKLAVETEKAGWAKTERVIGLGYDPRLKKVFFTVDSELVHVIHCKTEEFGSPLYPTIAANGDITVLVNFGQSSFSYAPANTQRTPNPCFIGPLANSPALGYEDSKELFSMGRIDSQWLNRSATKATHFSSGAKSKGVDFDEESEADLFEIVLDSSTGRSPNSTILRPQDMKHY